MSESEIRQILQDLSEIKNEIKHLKAAQSDPVICALHGKSIEDIEVKVEVIEKQVGQQNMLKIGLGAIGAGIVLALKYAVPAVWEALKK